MGQSSDCPIESSIVKLNIFERFTLLDLLPKEGHYADLMTLRRAREILAITAEEKHALNYSEKDDGQSKIAFFDVTKALEMEKDLPVDEWTTRTVQNILAKIEKDGKLSERLLSLYEKFVVSYA
jgi:hypothetical protein